jgi:hypothetical protein
MVSSMLTSFTDRDGVLTMASRGTLRSTDSVQMLPIQVPAPGPTESCFFLALSFVCGFSERLAQDIVAKLEDGLLQDEAQQPGQEPAAVSRTGASSV